MTGGWGSLEYGPPPGFSPGVLRGGRWKPLHYWFANFLFTDIGVACGVGGACCVRGAGCACCTRDVGCARGVRAAVPVAPAVSAVPAAPAILAVPTSAVPAVECLPRSTRVRRRPAPVLCRVGGDVCLCV